ncbi:NAD-dependent epimerase/dehydratase family protein [Actinocrispum wychmicini]|uniref:Nucleoside-diphosphate-sugar epimerase n=1 Tax=Actinocrispum wychmicini TaxID=1213861 RepID=A0A4R2JTF4_9PSEU|nr:NAD-dependent epimerase/dehydratase family protein [Actinocrispum wychmicini]TCO60546.1 nucleoside-diphosphate-sugar epimerase [Actinocrispum wychmicini]
MASARVLLFGASGFLGREVGNALNGDPRVAVVIQVGRSAPDEPGWARHDLIGGDPDRLAAVLRAQRPDVVVNCTGRLDGTTAELVSANVLATANLLDAIRDVTPKARLVTLGSAGEYGVVPTGAAVTEDSPARPVAAYGVTKLAGTMLVQSAVDSGLDAVVLRVFNPIGAGIAAGTVLGRAAASIRAAMAGGVEHIQLGPLGAYRDFVDVRDVATAISAAALSAEQPPPVLNVGSGVAVATRDTVAMLADVAGFTGQVREADPAPARSGAVTWIAADLTRIERTLGWHPKYGLADSVREIWG